MAIRTVRRASLYVDGLLKAEVTSNDLGIESGDTRLDAWDGSDYFSDGNDMTTLNFDTVIPIDDSFDILLLQLSKKAVKVGWVSGQTALECEGRFLSQSYKSDSKTGTLTGNFRFEGGKIVVV